MSLRRSEDERCLRVVDHINENITRHDCDDNVATFNTVMVFLIDIVL